MAVTVAGIDCGTNSIRLMVARVDGTGVTVLVPRIMRVVRLGQGVDKTRRFSQDALQRTFAAIDEFARILNGYDLDGIRFVATSATRDATNRNEFEDYVYSRLGVRPDVIPGEEEARLSFLGATSVVDTSAHQAPYLVMDLGGGSTELVLGGDGRSIPVTDVSQAYSMDTGSVRISERHLLSDPPDDGQIVRAADDVNAAIDTACAAVDISRTGTFIGVSGTVTTMASVALGLSTYDRDAVDGALLDISRIYEADSAVLHMDRAQRGSLGVIHPGRLDVIGAGALIFTEVLKRVSLSVQSRGRELSTVMVSEHGLLDGIVRDLGIKLLAGKG